MATQTQVNRASSPLWKKRAAGFSRSFWIGVVLIAVMLALAILGWRHPPYNPTAMAISGRFASPSLQHLMGTDEYGRDVFSRVLVSLSASFTVALIALASGLVGGSLIGGIAGFAEGWIAEVLMRMMDAAFAFPHLLLSLLILIVLGPGQLSVSLAIGIFNIPVFARLTYAAVLEGKQLLFVKAAQCMGAGPVYILSKHLLFYAAPTLLVQLTSSFSVAILTEASLSFLGLGIQPPHPSLGGLLAESKDYLTQSIGLSIYPGLVLLVTVLGASLMGDGLEGRVGRW